MSCNSIANNGGSPNKYSHSVIQAFALRWHHLAKEPPQPREDWFSQQEFFMALTLGYEEEP